MGNALYRVPENVRNALAGPEPVMGMSPTANRLSLLPRYSAADGFVAPQWVYDLARAAQAPGNALMGHATTPDEAFNFGGNLVGAGLGASTAAPVKGRVIGMAVKPDYGIAHRPPGRHYGAAAHDLTTLLPDDIYSPQAARYYGHGDSPAMDAETVRTFQRLRGKPDAMVTIYRAVPSDVPADAAIGAGDWVTINKKYAMQHGESTLQGNYRILETKVPAKDIFTSGDSIHEWGYDPTP
jgi:hypothetical protein